MQALARRRGLITAFAIILLLVFGFFLFRTPLEIPSLKIEPLARIGGYPLRNSVVQTWLAMLVLLAIVFLATRKMTLVPGRLQGLVETIIEAFLGMAERAGGRKNGRRIFPVFLTIFLFVLSANWLGLVPGVGTIGFVVPADKVIQEAHHEGKSLESVELLVFKEGPLQTLPIGSLKEMTVSGAEYEEQHGVPEGKTAGHLNPFFRPTNTDINTPLALAIWSFIFVEFWGITSQGFFPYMGKFFNFSKLLRGKLFEGFIDLFVGLLELILEFVRLLSFTFRLFFNILAGEILIVLSFFLVPLVLMTLVFVLELFFGAIQAFIFAILTLIFGVMAVTSHHGPEEGHGGHGTPEAGHAV